MSRIITAGITICALLCVTDRASGQGSVDFGPHLGIQKTQESDDASLLVGATLRLKLLPGLGAEGDIGYRQEKFGNDAVIVKDWPVTVTGLLYVLPVLYGGVGAGWYNSTIDYADVYNQVGINDETTQEFGWHVAAGIELPASPNLKVFGDVRYVFLDREFRELPGAVVNGDKSDFSSINFGLLFGL